MVHNRHCIKIIPTSFLDSVLQEKDCEIQNKDAWKINLDYFIIELIKQKTGVCLPCQQKINFYLKKIFKIIIVEQNYDLHCNHCNVNFPLNIKLYFQHLVSYHENELHPFKF